MSEYICPHCKKPIYDDEALLCLYCGESLRRYSGPMSSMKYRKPRVILFVAVALALAGFVILILR